MSKFFYSKLGLSNIKNNKSIYIPYLVAGTFIVSLFYILLSVSYMIADAKFSGGVQMAIIINICTLVCLIFSIIILFYINSFVMKRRKKEFGLYSILGMEKRHISIVMFFEVLFSSIICIGLGIVVGILLSQAMFLILLKLVKISAALTFTVPLDAIWITAVVFIVFFAAILIIDIIKIARTKPIDLLHSTSTGEKEPKAKWLIALFGLITLGLGYYLSISVKSPSGAIGIFLIAVLLVIAGTYCLFISGSIAVLKLLKKNKKFYYKPRNFVSVSGMMYRMKQNATGLASICILATAVLVTMSSTVCLFIGEEDLLKRQFPRQVVCITQIDSLDDENKIITEINDSAKEKSISIDNKLGYQVVQAYTRKEQDKYALNGEFGDSTVQLVVIPLNNYNSLKGENKTLSDNEILAFSDNEKLNGTIKFLDKEYKIKETVEMPEEIKENTIVKQVFIVVKDFNELKNIADYDNNMQGKQMNITSVYCYDVGGTQENTTSFLESLKNVSIKANNGNGTNTMHTSYIEYARSEFYQLYGTLMFIGMFFTMIFLVATILIIYYKQITEGFDDHDRFNIMQKVGMSKKEVRSTINKQVLMVFFLPLIVAAIHILAAFPSLRKCLLTFGMTNTGLFLLCVLGTVLIFSILYFIVYKLTARTYYKIVEQR